MTFDYRFFLIFLKAKSAIPLNHLLIYFPQLLNMASKNKKTVPFVCPGCLTVYHLLTQEAEGKVPKCCHCGIPLERIKNRR